MINFSSSVWASACYTPVVSLAPASPGSHCACTPHTPARYHWFTVPIRLRYLLLTNNREYYICTKQELTYLAASIHIMVVKINCTCQLLSRVPTVSANRFKSCTAYSTAFYPIRTIRMQGMRNVTTINIPQSTVCNQCILAHATNERIFSV